MGREHRSSRRSPRPPVPVAPIAGYCSDESVNGAPFYVMEFVDGPDPADAARAPRPFGEPDRRAIGERVVDTLVEIHAVDPDEIGLGDLGKKDDYVARQLRRWGPVGGIEDARAPARSRRSTTGSRSGSPTRARPRSSTATTGSTT